MIRRLSGMAAGPSVLFASLLLCGAERAAAHDPPTGTAAYARADQLVVRTPRGLIVGRSTLPASAREFRFLCNEALGVAEFDVPSVLLQADASMLVGTSVGLVRVSPDLCTIDALPALSARVTALVRAADDSREVYAATDAGLFYSNDDAQSFSEQDANAFDSLQLPHADVVYATGRYPGPRTQPRVYFARWQRGAALEQHELTLEPTEVSIALLGFDPGREQRVFAVAHAYLGTPDLDRFLISDDAAKTWTSPFSAASVGAFAFDRASDTWLVGAASGLWRASGDKPPVQVRDAAVSCLSFAATQLFVCDGAGSQGGLSLSADGGDSWASVFRFNQVAGLAACAPDSKVVQQCQMAWADWAREMPYVPLTPAATPDAGVDAGKAGHDADAAADAGAADGGSSDAAVDGGSALRSEADSARTSRDAAPSSQNMLSPTSSSGSCAAVSGTGAYTRLWPWLLPAAVLFRRMRRQHRSPNQRKQT